MTDMIFAGLIGFAIGYLLFGRKHVVELHVINGQSNNQPHDAFVAGVMIPAPRGDVCSECKENCSSECGCWCHGKESA